MGCVIDHLRADHRVRVLRDFVDEGRIRMRAGEEGVIRRMDVDFGRNEIYIDWECQGTLQRLVFSLTSKEGPGNGRMRHFFELGDFVPEIRMNAGCSAGPSHASQPNSSAEGKSSAEVGMERCVPPGTCLNEISVACSCHPGFHRSLIPAGQVCVHACLGCGTITCTERVGDEGRYTGDAYTAYITLDVPAPVMKWLALWPRVKMDHAGAPNRWPMSADLVRYPTLYYPADLRCGNDEELSKAELRLALEQANLSRTEVLRNVSCPAVRPPAGLPSFLQGFSALWEALQLTMDSDLNTLIHLAQLRNPGSAVAADLLIRRADAFEVLEKALNSSDATWNSAAIAMARDFRGDRARLAAILLTAMNRASLEPSSEVPGRVVGWSRLESLLVAVGDLKLNSPEMILELNALQRRLKRSDDFLASAVGVILKELSQTLA